MLCGGKGTRLRGQSLLRTYYIHIQGTVPMFICMYV